MIRFAEHGSFKFRGDAYYGGDDTKNLAYYEAGDQIRIRFTYDAQSSEIRQISELELEQNVRAVRGDVDKNGRFERNDLVLVQRWLLSQPDTVLAEWQAGDLDGNGRLNAADLTLMKRELMHI